jgi:hypothetical protein
MDGWSWREGQHPWAWWLLFVIVIATCMWGLRRLRRYRRSRIAKKALSAERAALRLLRCSGYVILDTQVRQIWPVRHGEHQLDVNLRADALVRRGNRRFIAEVKSTSLVADLKHGPTRRQLLEYAVAYGTDGVLLIDMYAEQVEEITFPGLQRPPGSYPTWSLFATCLVALVMVTWFAAKRFG